LDGQACAAYFEARAARALFADVCRRISGLGRIACPVTSATRTSQILTAIMDTAANGSAMSQKTAAATARTGWSRSTFDPESSEVKAELERIVVVMVFVMASDSIVTLF
jgi:hypothetical protein